MNSPSAAFAWELWCRHRRQWWTMVALLVGFALFYPALCASVGMKLGTPDPFAGDFEQFFKSNKEGMTLSVIVRVIEAVFLLAGPYACMGASLFYLCHVFTFAEMSARYPMVVPTRTFTLPVSTTFLASWLMIGGIVTVSILNLAWHALVPLPGMDELAGFSELLPWITLLLVVQAVVWSLSNFPFTRILVLVTASAAVAFMASPAVRDVPFLERNRTLVLLAVALTAGVLGQVGLHKVRHGAWRTWSWQKRLVALIDAANPRGPGQFESQARALFWFQWRAIGRPLVLLVMILAGVPFLFIAVVVVFSGPLTDDEPFRLALSLAAIPPFLFFCAGTSPGSRRHLPFTGVRPVTSGELIVAELKVLAFAAALSWIFILALFCLLPLLGEFVIPNDMPVLLENADIFWAMSPVFLLGLMFLTWRLGMAHQWCNVVPSKLTGLWVLVAFYGYAVAGGIFIYFARQPEYRSLALRFVLITFSVLAVAKIILAQWTFRSALQRHLLSPMTMRKYFILWVVLAAFFLTPVLALWHEAPWISIFILGIVLLLPLARIGFGPVALSHARHG